MWASSAHATAPSAAAIRPRDGRSVARSTSHSAASATVSPTPFLTYSMVRYVEPAENAARPATASPVPFASRSPSANAGRAISAPPTAAPSLAPVIGSVSTANGAMNQNVNGEAG